MIIVVFFFLIVGTIQNTNSTFDFLTKLIENEQDSIPFDSRISKALFEYNDYVGLQGFYKWAQEKVEPLYTPGIEGRKRITVNFTITKKGSITGIKVNGVGKKDAHRIKKILKSSPRWHPATKDNKGIKMDYLMPLYVINGT